MRISIRPAAAASALALGITVMASTSVSAQAQTTGGQYVALGDSYTSAPFVPSADPTAPPLCLRSAGNYPHLVAAQIGATLSDVSCAGATVSNMTSSQYPGQPAQFDALTPSTTLVTLGIGGNDNNTFATAVAGCMALGASTLGFGTPCKNAFGSKFSDAIASDAPNIAAAIQAIHSRSPQAQVLVVGYPRILPPTGNCYTSAPITVGDVAYLNGVEADLNAMLQATAQSNGATYVDTFTPSLGHDFCQSASVRWVEPPAAQNGAVSVHPNAAGEAAMSRAVLAALS